MKILNTVIAVEEEPGDSTKYSHVFEFSWNFKQFMVHKHPFRSGVSLKAQDTLFDTDLVMEIAELIEGRSIYDQLDFVKHSTHLQTVAGDQNVYTLCSMVRCLKKIIDKG